MSNYDRYTQIVSENYISVVRFKKFLTSASEVNVVTAKLMANFQDFFPLISLKVKMLEKN